jgi:hypothetical protein
MIRTITTAVLCVLLSAGEAAVAQSTCRNQQSTFTFTCAYYSDGSELYTQMEYRCGVKIDTKQWCHCATPDSCMACDDLGR